MRRWFGFLTSKWLVTLIGAIALCLLIWFIGPLIAIGGVAILENDLLRFALVMVVLVAWGIINIFSRVKAAKTNEQMVDALTDGANHPDAAESAAEVEALRERLEDALTLLKKSAGKKARGMRYLYELPWYIFIGPPGSGKTKALEKSGLNFPVAEKLGQAWEVKGVGGTRNCDWLLTDEAVLLDTAGRYTTQDSNKAVDEGAWKGFLELLKRFRPRQPINGALVAFGVPDIAGMSAEERHKNAVAVRTRLTELQETFGVRFPIYVLLTKIDLVAGFIEFFDDLGREQREQIWGMTLPLDRGAGDAPPAVTQVGGEFDALVARLNERLLEQLQRELDVGRRALIFGFPTQIAALKEPILDFLNEIFMPSRYGHLLLRGVYFTSAVQEGTPFDRLLAGMAAIFGMEGPRLSAFSGGGRSYFLTRLFRDVIFAEASIVSSNPTLERRQALLTRAAYAAALLVVLGLGGAWTVSYIGNEALISNTETQVQAYQKIAAPVAVTEVTDGDVQAVLPVLDALRAMPGGYGSRNDSAPMSLDFGLYQGGKLGMQAQHAYARALIAIFRPRLLIRLGDQIRANLRDPDYVQEALKAYLMLGGQGPLDKEFIRAWMTLDWKTAFPGADKEPMRADLAGNLEAMLERPIESINLDGDVVSSARQVLQQSPLASRAYNTMKNSAAARQLPEWRIIDHAGPAADRVVMRDSGQPLNAGVPGFYTPEGYYKVFLPSLASLARDVAKESWVIGADNAKAADQTPGRLEQDISDLYASEYVEQWVHLLGDIEPTSFSNLQQASDALNKLSAPSSPLKLLLISVAKETDLVHPPQEAAAATAGLSAVSPEAAAKLESAAARLGSIVKDAAQAAGVQTPASAQAVTDHFRDLQRFVGSGGTGPAPVDDMLQGLNGLYLQVSRLSIPGAAGGSGASGDTDATQRLIQDGARLPPPANKWVVAIARNISALTAGGTRARISDDYQSKVLPFCQRAINNRYPIFHDSQVDVPFDDFARVFGPNGLLDTFFSANLKPYVDTSHLPWRWLKVQNVDLGLSPEVLLQFQRAEAIRQSFFAGGGTSPSIRLQFVPLSLDPSANEVLMTIDGQEVSYSHGPPRPVPVQWPGKSGVSEARLAMLPAQEGLSSSISVTGPWSLFRLFDAATIDAGGGTDRLKVTFRIGSRKAVWEVQANSVVNPLIMNELREFRCPPRL